MKTFREVKTGDMLYRVCFSDYSVETMTVYRVGKSEYDNSTMIHYSVLCGAVVLGSFVKEIYEEDLDKCWLYDTLSYAICTDYEAIDVAIKENRAIDKAIRKNHKKPKRKKI